MFCQELLRLEQEILRSKCVALIELGKLMVSTVLWGYVTSWHLQASGT